MTRNSSFDPYLEPGLIARVPRMADDNPQLPSFTTGAHRRGRAGQLHRPLRSAGAGDVRPRRRRREPHRHNRWYEQQHQELDRRGIIGLPYAEKAPHLLTSPWAMCFAGGHQPALPGHADRRRGVRAGDARAGCVRQRFLHDVARMDGLLTGGTWATEQQGGSDVGATTTVAVAHGDHFTLHGLKWFTSNANSSLAVATARPDGAPSGTAGWVCTWCASHLDDGQPNRYRVRRLKDKLGTKGLPIGEIELLGAEADEIAPPPEGFKLMMEALEYSRVHNAVGAAGVQRRALSEALAWTKTVRRSATRCRLSHGAGRVVALAGAVRGWSVAGVRIGDRVRRSSARPDRRTWLRLTTALAKYLTAEYAIEADRAALELFGGNGYTSDYPWSRCCATRRC